MRSGREVAASGRCAGGAVRVSVVGDAVDSFEGLGDGADAEAGVHRERRVDAGLLPDEMSESVQVGVVAGFESIDDGQHFACGEVEGCKYWDAVDCGWGFEEG